MCVCVSFQFCFADGMLDFIVLVLCYFTPINYSQDTPKDESVLVFLHKINKKLLGMLYILLFCKSF